MLFLIMQEFMNFFMIGMSIEGVYYFYMSQYLFVIFKQFKFFGFIFDFFVGSFGRGIVYEQNSILWIFDYIGKVVFRVVSIYYIRGIDDDVRFIDVV